jgi:hypothetical protein
MHSLESTKSLLPKYDSSNIPIASLFSHRLVVLFLVFCILYIRELVRFIFLYSSFFQIYFLPAMKLTYILPLGIVTAALATPWAGLQKRAACAGNTPTTRSTWCEYNVDTDYESIVPNTGVTREYWFVLTQVTIAPDGFSRTAMTVNGTIPGPTIIANWGDNIIVHVTNNLAASHNGTSIHWYIQ